MSLQADNSLKARERLMPNELAELLRSAETDRDRVILRVLANSGVRVGELCALSATDIDFSARVLRIPWQKSRGRGEYREVNISAAALEHLRAFMGEQTVGPVFVGRTSHRLTTRSVQRMIAACARRAGLGRVVPHTLRHTFATQWVNDGGTAEALMVQMGHRNINTTMVYVHASAAYVRGQFNKVRMAI